MPFLRFSRDRRGYESTYLVHTFRRRGKSRAQILYWFRSPPNVRVGRVGFDEDTIRSIEESYPDLAFDWPRILKHRPPPIPYVDEDGPRRRRPATAKSGGRRAAPRTAPARKKRTAEEKPTAAVSGVQGRAERPRKRRPPDDPVPRKAPLAAVAEGSPEEAPAEPSDVKPVKRRRRSRRGGVRRTRRRKVATGAGGVESKASGADETTAPKEPGADDSARTGEEPER